MTRCGNRQIENLRSNGDRRGGIVRFGVGMRGLGIPMQCGRHGGTQIRRQGLLLFQFAPNGGGLR